MFSQAKNGTGNPHSPEVKYSAARTPKRAIFPTLIWKGEGRGLNFPYIFFRDFRLCSVRPMQTKRLPPFWLRKNKVIM